MISIYVVMFPKWCVVDPNSLSDYLKWYEITTVTMGITFVTVNRVVNRWRLTIYTVKSGKNMRNVTWCIWREITNRLLKFMKTFYIYCENFLQQTCCISLNQLRQPVSPFSYYSEWTDVWKNWQLYRNLIVFKYTICKQLNIL